VARIRSAVAALLIIAACILPKALADPYLMDAGSIWISESSKEYLDDSGHVLRYRIVSVDSDRLQASLVGLAEDAGTGDMPTLELQLFDDVSLIVGVRSWTGWTFKVVVRLAGATCGSDLDRDGSNGSLNFSKQGHVVGRFWVCDQIYTIGPTNDLVIPYHVIRMLDPENLPSID
jgi:hypothetical protein